MNEQLPIGRVLKRITAQLRKADEMIFQTDAGAKKSVYDFWMGNRECLQNLLEWIWEELE